MPQASKPISLKVPIKPHLIGYLANYYETPYKLNQSDDIGIFLYHLLRRREFKERSYDNLSNCTQSFEVTIPKYFMIDRGCLLLHDNQVHIFNNYLDMMMMRNCFIYLDGRMMHGHRLKDYVYDWIDDNNLVEGSEDWYHKIKKAYYRYRKRKEKNNSKTTEPCVLRKS